MCMHLNHMEVSMTTTKNTSKATTPTLLDLSEKFIQHLEKIGKSPGTCFSYAMDLKLALAELGEKTRLNSLTLPKVQAFFECDRTTKTKGGLPKAEVTIKKTMRVLRFALEWAVEKGWIESAPLPDNQD